MDIIDVILGKTLSSSGQIDIYAARAAKAVQDANAAVAAITDAADNIEELTEQTQANNETAQATITNLNEAIEHLETAEAEIRAVSDQEIKKLALSMTRAESSGYIGIDLITTYPDNTDAELSNLVKYYTGRGQNVDGTMTQRAITAELTALERRIDQGGGSGGSGSINLGPENAGNIVVVGDDGNISSGSIEEEGLVDLLLEAGTYSVKNAVGITIDYKNRTFTRIVDSAELAPGSDYDAYPMYGGRKRCNVNAAGRITAWYGDSNYKEDGSNGDVMVYQPKFYYFRNILESKNSKVGKIVQKETLILSEKKYAKFKVHPRFINAVGEELDYVLLPAYESCLYHPNNNTWDENDSQIVNDQRDCLFSRANVKPISGRYINLDAALGEQLAKNKGTGWHMTDLGIESINQMLFMVEYGTMNAQTAIGRGVSDINANNIYNCSSLTGSTSVLGNNTGAALSTQNEINDSYNTYTNDGYVAISYRGCENWWGNTWRFIGGLNIYGDGEKNGGVPYICSDFNYTPDVIGDNYKSMGFSLPNAGSWISAMGYGESDCDWAYLPAEAYSANSALPVGDYVWTISNLNQCYSGRIGGHCAYGNNNGLFSYAFDHDYSSIGTTSSARIMFIPTKNSIYNANYASWKAKMGA